MRTFADASVIGNSRIEVAAISFGSAAATRPSARADVLDQRAHRGEFALADR